MARSDDGSFLMIFLMIFFVISSLNILIFYVKISTVSIQILIFSMKILDFLHEKS